jgi:Transposase IS116/IS110/IS902 family
VQITLLDYVGAIEALLIRRDSLEHAIAELVPESPWASAAARLRCLRGIDTLSAAGLCAEIGDFAHFGRPGQLMSFLGVVPSENTTGAQRRQSTRSPSPGPVTLGGGWSRRRGTTERRPGPARCWPVARPVSLTTFCRSPGKLSSNCTAPGTAWIMIAANAARSFLELLGDPQSAHIVVEATDGWEWLAELLEEAG